MKRFLLLIILCFSFFQPNYVFALASDYEDVVYDKVGVELEEDVVNIYLFYGSTCPHCAKEKEVLDKLEVKYEGKVKVYKYEVWSDKDNRDIMFEVKNLFDMPVNEGVPFTVIGTKTYYGYDEWVGTDLEKQLVKYLEFDNIDDDDTIVEKDKINIPLIGKVNPGEIAVGVAAVTLGLVDGFNPCAMWVLLFIINMLLGMKDKKKMFILGYTFLFTSAVVYFLSMLGVNIVLGFLSTNELRSLIGLVAIGAGIYNLYVYFRDRNKDDGCAVVDEKKRKNILEKVKRIKNSKSIIFALGGIILLAVSVNLVELACSAGFPMIFNEVLVANDITGGLRIIYLLVYVLFYMIDDMVVFTISVCTLSIVGMTTKYNKIVKIIGGILMVLMGLLLIFKPEWIMLNF
ncbi:MAG: hypothetical protein IJN90_07170 [Bacilli bacterium]|nr:hypothetical protein [Bacilli bacterium]